MIDEKNFPRSIRGRTFTRTDVEIIRNVINCPSFTARAAIAREVCKRLNWYRPNGQLKDAACRYALLKLHQDNMIQLPLPRRNPFVKSNIIFTTQTDSKPSITDNAGKLKPLTFQSEFDSNRHIKMV
ncbi:MAG: hypothetical protein JSW07_16835 [bacterium]|nr:MAG: hypothetical protein JSW07_16835 [bacterium]